MTHSYREVFLKSLLSSLVVVGLLFGSVASFITPVQALAADSINLWWPTNGAHVSGTQPFKAMIQNVDVSQYDMYWRVDGGSWVNMYNSYTDYQHKEAMVDLSGWSWHGSGPYVIDFSARKNGSEIATVRTTIYIDNGLPQSSPSPAPAPTPTPAPAQTTQTVAQATVQVAAPTANITIASVPSASSNPLANFKFYVDPNSAAAHQLSQWQNSYSYGAQLMQTLANASTARWFGEWNGNVSQDVHSYVAAAQSAGSVPVIVAYDIPQRDCGGYSGGGNNADGYRSWINALASGIGSANAVVILEPDALAQIDCLSSQDQQTRLSLLSNAVSVLKQNAGTKVYLDAGHSGWVDAGVMADRLNKSNVYKADGFALNVSNFNATSDETSYGSSVSSKLNGKHFVIDTSRNGNGSNGQWCNPWGRAIGAHPTTSTGNALIDAYLWAKVPGESDGNCNGGPSAGSWWSDYAVSLVQNAH